MLGETFGEIGRYAHIAFAGIGGALQQINVPHRDPHHLVTQKGPASPPSFAKASEGTATQGILHSSAMRPSDAEWSRRDSNPRPTHCERVALPTELRPHFYLSGLAKVLHGGTGILACSSWRHSLERPCHATQPRKAAPPKKTYLRQLSISVSLDL